MLTNQNHFETKCHCADQSDLLHKRLSQCSGNVALTISTCTEGRGETVGMGFSSYHVCSQGPAQGVSQSLSTELSPQVHILNVSFPPSGILGAIN